MSDPALQLVAALLVLLAPVGVLVGTMRPSRADWLVTLVGGVAGAAASIATDALAGPIADPPARILDAAIAAAVTAIVATLAARRLGALGGSVFAALWSVLILPAALAAVIGDFPPLVQSLIGAVDFAGVLATHVAAGAALLVVHLLPAPRGVEPSPAATSWRRALIGGGLVLAGATAWIVGVERVVDAATGRLLANAVIGVALAAITWMLVEKIGWNRVTPAAVPAAVWGGWAAIGIGAPFLAPPALAAAAVLGGAVGSAMSGAGTVDAPDAPPRRSWTMGAIGAAATGGVVLALLADGFGLAATGTLVLAAAEVAAVVVVAVLAAIGGLVCWTAARAVVIATRGLARARARRG